MQQPSPPESARPIDPKEVVRGGRDTEKTFSSSLFQSVAEAIELVRTHRHSLFRLCVYDFQQRYAGSVFGRLWWLLSPILFLVCYSVVFIYIYKLNLGRLSALEYSLYVFAGYVSYQLFTEALGAGAISLLQNKSLLLNSVFPAELLPIRAVLTSQVMGYIGLGLAILMSFAIGRGSSAVIAAFIILALMTILMMGVGFFLSPLTLVLRDIPEILRFLNIVLLIMSPVSFFVDSIPDALRVLVLANPLAHYMINVQSAIVFGQWPSLFTLSWMASLALLVFFGGLVFLSRVKVVLSDYAG